MIGRLVILRAKPIMKELIIVRHAKSDWGDSSLDDHDRPLNGRGERTAPQMAQLLAGKLRQEGATVDAMITSTALRAKTTAKIFADALEFPEADLERRQNGYLASANEWLRIVAGVDENFQRVALFGHNPGFHFLVNELVSRDDWIDHMPTCAVVRIALKSDTWGAIGQGDGRLIEYLIPREIL
jgi:phosphohistidine phosphatase